MRPPRFLALIAFCLIAVTRAVDVSKAFTDNEIVPDVLQDTPRQTLSVTWGSRVSAQLGNELRPSQTKAAPELSWTCDDQSALYTVAMVDPDAPSRQNPRAREWRHWVVVDVPGTRVADGVEVTSYNGPAPPAGTGLHRYVLLVYKQPGKLSASAKNQGSSRARWSISQFAEKNQLGSPVAGNFFQAKH